MHVLPIPQRQAEYAVKLLQSKGVKAEVVGSGDNCFVQMHLVTKSRPRHLRGERFSQERIVMIGKMPRYRR